MLVEGFNFHLPHWNWHLMQCHFFFFVLFNGMLSTSWLLKSTPLQIGISHHMYMKCVTTFCGFSRFFAVALYSNSIRIQSNMRTYTEWFNICYWNWWLKWPKRLTTEYFCGQWFAFAANKYSHNEAEEDVYENAHSLLYFPISQENRMTLPNL